MSSAGKGGSAGPGGGGSPPAPSGGKPSPANSAPPQSSAPARTSASRAKPPAVSGMGKRLFPAGKLFGAEFAAAVAINCWQALKQGQVPFPGTVMRTAAAFGILSFVYYLDEDIAGVLGAGFLAALIVSQASGGFEVFAASDPDGTFYYLTFNGSSNSDSNTVTAASNG